MTQTILPVLMSGGAGTRLWPLSSPERPKQFHVIGSGSDTMIQATARRFLGETPGVRFLPPVVIGNQAHADLILEQLAPVSPPQTVILEPEGRNTAATALLAALIGETIDPEALVFLAPSDHLIADPEGFRAMIAQVAPLARERIMTLGITPEWPATGYGYIRRGDALGAGAFAIAAFEEKPEREKAEAYVAADDYAWNAGMFFFAPRLVREEFAALPAIAEPVAAAFAARRQEGRLHFLPRDLFCAAQSQAFDVAVMEKTKRGAVAPCAIGWADVGSWTEIYRLAEKDSEGVAGFGRFAVEDAAGCYVHTDGPPVGVIGLKDVVVVATATGVLVAALDRAQDVRGMAKALAPPEPKPPS